MRILLLILFSLPAFANFPNQVAFKLDAGVKSFRLNNSGSVGGTLDRVVGVPAAWARVGVVVTPGIFVPPTASTTYTTCADPCGQGGSASTTTMNMQWGQQYIWLVKLDSGGTPVSPFTVSAVAGAYNANVCGGTGTLPMVEPSVVTTAPLPMPREVIGQDCYVDRVQLPLISGHASTSLRLWARIHSAGYNTLGRSDGKLSVKVNSGSWIALTNANSSVVRVDELKYYSRLTTGGYDQNVVGTTILAIGGYGQVADYLITIPDGTVGSGDTTYQVAWRHNGTENNGSGARILEMSLVEGTDRTMTQIVTTSNVSVATSSSHGYSSGNNILLRNAPGMRMVFNGPRLLSAADTNTFTLTPCGAGSGGSKTSSCTSPDGTFTVPVKRDDGVTYKGTEQPVMYATRMLTAASDFTYPDPATEAAPGSGDPVEGACLFTTSNPCGGGSNVLVLPTNQFLSYASAVHCKNCHTTTGSDLKYFNMTNHAIAQRSYFHGLSQQNGLDIAAYIRGLTVAVPSQARPWNPPMQNGPGMSNGTWTKAATTLTSIVVSSNVATATIPGNHNIKTGDPIIVSGATVDTDLNTTARTAVTVTGATTFTFATTSVANGTYTESTLVINMANDFMAGCGVDCVLTYAVDQIPFLAPSGDKSKWVWDSRTDARNLPWPWQFGDWNKTWLATMHPVDTVPNAAFATSTPYLEFLTLNAVTPWSFAAYKAAGYGTTLFHDYLAYWGRGTGDASQNLPTSTNLVRLYANSSPAWSTQGNYALIRQSVVQMMMIQQFELSVDKGWLGMDGQRMADINGAATAYQCYPPWGFADKSFTFNIGSHKVQMDPLTIVDGQLGTFLYAANIWYVAAFSIGNGGCYGTPDNPLDAGYLQAFLRAEARYRSQSHMTALISAILDPQGGNQNTNFNKATGAFSEGTDVSNVVHTTQFPNEFRFDYPWFTTSSFTTHVDDSLNVVLAMINAHTTSYWNTMWVNGNTASPGSEDCSTTGSAWNAGAQDACALNAANLTFYKLFGANSTNVTTYLNWAKALSLWSGHDFDVDIAAATQGDAANGATGNIATAGSGKTITFTTCPSGVVSYPSNMPYVLGTDGGGDVPERLYPTGGTCTTGNPGTLVFTTARNHSGTMWATYGCSQNHLFPNWMMGGDPANTPWYRCSNMF